MIEVEAVAEAVTEDMVVTVAEVVVVVVAATLAMTSRRAGVPVEVLAALSMRAVVAVVVMEAIVEETVAMTGVTVEAAATVTATRPYLLYMKFALSSAGIEICFKPC
jgi:hypothetical protein